MLLLPFLLLSCSSDTPQAEPQVSVMVDIDTGQIFTMSSMPVVLPANPQTGKKTLQNALYCPQCQEWYPVPSIEILQRSQQARLCPKTKTPLQTDGPVPENALPLEDHKEL